MKQLGIIGCGVVGGALYDALSHLDRRKELLIVRYDPDLFDTEPHQLADCDIVFVCVPSPMLPSGRQDDRILRKTLRMLVGIDYKGVVVIKTTTLPTVLRELDELFNLTLVSNPEFLTEKNAVADCFAAEFHIVGSDDDQAKELVSQLYIRYWPLASVVKLSLLAGMWVKYVINAHLALRVASMNESYRLWDEIGDGTPWDSIVLALRQDPRMGDSHMDVPGPDGRFGFGGKCFPKDLNALIHMADAADLPMRTMEAAWDFNQMVREDHDWHNIEGAVSSAPDDPDEDKDNA
jgi:UDPglucose 6-dehydrogenase